MIAILQKTTLPSATAGPKVCLKPLSTIWDELTDADFPARPPSAPSNIETISLWGPRYPGQKLHPEVDDLMSPIREDPALLTSSEPDNAEIWDSVVNLCGILRGLIEALPPCKEEVLKSNPHGPISAGHLQEAGELFIQSLEPLRPLRGGKLTDFSLSKSPELVVHVRQLEHRFDDLERVLDTVPRVFDEVTFDDCRVAMDKVETIMITLGVGREEY